jgi:hypothetical protein
MYLARLHLGPQREEGVLKEVFLHVAQALAAVQVELGFHGFIVPLESLYHLDVG